MSQPTPEVTRRLLLVHDDPEVMTSIRGAAHDAGYLPENGWSVVECASRTEAEAAFSSDILVAVIDLSLRPTHDDEDGLAVIYGLRKRSRTCMIMALTHHKNDDTGMYAMDVGADEFMNARWKYVNWVGLLKDKLRFYRQLVEGRLERRNRVAALIQS